MPHADDHGLAWIEEPIVYGAFLVGRVVSLEWNGTEAIRSTSTGIGVRTRFSLATAIFCPTRTTSRLPRGDASIKQVPLQHGITLGQKGMTTAGYSEPWPL